MIELKCPHCGGSISVDNEKREGICDYCGSKVLMELAQGEKEQLNIIREVPEVKKRQQAPMYTAYKESDDGHPIEIRYLYERVTDEYVMYVTKENVLFCFNEEHREDARLFTEGIKRVRFPNEEMRKKMHYYFPDECDTYFLTDHQVMVAIKRVRDVYPLELSFALDEKHMAWIVSRLENMSCVLEYSGISFSKVLLSDLFFDPEHHQVFLYGGWQRVITKAIPTEVSMAIRDIAMNVCGYTKNTLPKDFILPLREFMCSQPQQNAAADFGYWDSCLDRAFGKRRFAKMEVDEQQIYVGGKENGIWKLS